MALVALTDHKSGGDDEGCKQRDCAVADIGMGPAFRNAGHHRQERLFVVEGLYLAFLVDLSTSARFGGDKERPTMSRTLSTSQRVAGKSKVTPGRGGLS